MAGYKKQIKALEELLAEQAELKKKKSKESSILKKLLLNKQISNISKHATPKRLKNLKKAQKEYEFVGPKKK